MLLAQLKPKSLGGPQTFAFTTSEKPMSIAGGVAGRSAP
jgi:hypothetical protein